LRIVSGLKQGLFLTLTFSFLLSQITARAVHVCRPQKHTFISTKFCADLRTNSGKVLNTTMTLQTLPPETKMIEEKTFQKMSRRGFSNFCQIELLNICYPDCTGIRGLGYTWNRYGVHNSKRIIQLGWNFSLGLWKWENK